MNIARCATNPWCDRRFCCGTVFFFGFHSPFFGQRFWDSKLTEFGKTPRIRVQQICVEEMCNLISSGLSQLGRSFNYYAPSWCFRIMGNNATCQSILDVPKSSNQQCHIQPSSEMVLPSISNPCGNLHNLVPEAVNPHGRR